MEIFRRQIRTLSDEFQELLREELQVFQSVAHGYHAGAGKQN
jgi:hypothetical protein